MAAYLATVNLSGGRTTWPYELKTLPRATGKAIITQYDMPRRGTVPHDVEVDSSGVPWYGDQSRMYIGRLNPQTGEFTEHPLPELPAGRVGGIRRCARRPRGPCVVPDDRPNGQVSFRVSRCVRPQDGGAHQARLPGRPGRAVPDARTRWEDLDELGGNGHPNQPSDDGDRRHLQPQHCRGPAGRATFVLSARSEFER